MKNARIPRLFLLLAACTAASPGPPGFHFGMTAVGLETFGLDAQVPGGVAVGRSNPWGARLSQEFFRGAGMRLRLNGDLAWDEARETCFWLGCMDFSATGRYFWNTHYGAAALRASPDRDGFLGGFGAELGVSRFHYRWGVSEEGWDSPHPGGHFLAGTFVSRQAFLGADYRLPFRKGCWGFALAGGLRQTVAAWNTFTPTQLQGTPRPFRFPSYPLSYQMSIAWEL